MSTHNSSENHRSHERKTIAAPAVIVYENEEADCIVRDISFGGAKVETKIHGQVHMPVKLQINQHEKVLAEVVWQQDDQHGLKFKSYSPEFGQLLNSIAMYA